MRKRPESDDLNMHPKSPKKAGSLPGWIAPLIGAILGALVAMKAAVRNEGGVSIQWVVVGGVIGLLGGGVVWGIDIIRGSKSDDSTS